MKKLITLIFCMAVCGIAFGTDVSGTIVSNTTWNLAGSPYIVTGDVTVNSGATLTIDANVMVKFNNGRSIFINGRLDATNVTFTSSSTTPTSGIWNNIQFGSATYSGKGNLDNCIFLYGNQIYVQNGTVSFNGCSLDNFYYYGFQSADTLNITNTYINMPAYYSSYGYAVNALANAYITADNLDIANCRYGYNIAASGKVIATNGCSIIGADQYGAVVSGQINMSNADIDLTGYTSTGYGIEAGNGSVITLNQVNITHANYALHINSTANISITDCNFTANTWPAYYEGPGAVATAGTNNFTGNTRNTFYINFTTLSVAWTLPTINVPYYFSGSFAVNAAGSLTILSGNILKIKKNYGLAVDGILNANANPGDFIYFTSERDDNWGGDTNNDGTSTSPATNDWYGITFSDPSNDAACVLRRCKIRFAGYNNGGAVNTINASPTIDYCDLSNSYFGVKMQAASNPVFTNNTIGSSQITPIALSYEANPILTGNILSFSDNTYDAIGLLGGTMTANAILPMRNISSVQNITYLMLDNITIPQGLTLTINKGVVIKTYYPTSSYTTYRKFIVEGKLSAIGTPDSMIVFTSARDDNFGQPFDTNKDGSQTSPAIGDWGGFLFKATSDTTSKLNYSRIYYGDNNDHKLYAAGSTYQGGQITLENASPSILNCVIKHNEFGVYCAGNSHPRILNNSFDHSTTLPVAQSISASPIFSGNTNVNSGYIALGIIGEEVGLSGTLTKKDFAGYTNITYMLLNDLFINAGTNISIDSGVVVKVNTTNKIEVNGGLKIAGGINSGNKVVFTSLKDDNEGNPGDSNNDGSTTSPAGGDWGRIQFNETSDDQFCQVNNLKVKYGGYTANTIKGLLAFISANTTVGNVLLTNSSNYGFWVDGSSVPVIDQAVIQNCTNDPIAMSLTSDPQLTNFYFSNNSSNGIRIIEGTLSSNATLKKRNIAGFSNIAYIVEQLTISVNSVLTIEPGVVIKFKYDDNVSYYEVYIHKGYLVINGGLSAVGTIADPIIFTSSRDDSHGGDTNNDGNITAPDKGDWRCIEFNSTSIIEKNQFKNCIVSYGGAFCPGYPGYDEQQKYFKRFAEVCINSTSVVIDSCIFEHSVTSGLGIYGNASPVISHSEFTNIAATPITMSLFSDPVFGNNNIVSNVGLVGLGIAVENFSVNDTVKKRDFAGFQNITYIFYSQCICYFSGFCDYLFFYSSINSGTTIVIPEGIVFKYKLYDYSTQYTCQTLDVNGGLKILGTLNEPVVFTDYRDDSYGNPMDTNGDGSLTTPAIHSKYILNFNSTSDDANCIIDHAIFKYQNNAIQIQQASPTIKSSLFEKNNWGINMSGVSEPVIDSCTFNNLTYTPFEFSLVSFPASTIGNAISGTTYKALGVKAETMAQNVTLPKRAFGGLPNIPYYLHDNFTIGTSSVMTIEPGVVLKFNDQKSLTIKKGLMALGGSAADSNIVFTDIRDDFYGGDSNADGTATQPGYTTTPTRYPWQGLIFENESSDALCILDHCKVRYAGYNYTSTTYPGIILNSASPSIRNTSIYRNRTGIQANGASNPLVNNCDIYGNQVYGVQNVGQAFNINAENCWWGNNTGPTHSGNPGGTGDAVTNMVDYTPWRTNGVGNPLMGDVSLNGIIQAYDASLVLQHTVALITLDPLQQIVADVSGIAGITPMDASLILQYVIGVINYFPAELLSPFPGFTSEAELTLGNTIALPGQEFYLPVNIHNVSDVYGLQMTIQYSPEYLDALAVLNLVQGMNFTFHNDREKGLIRISYAGTAPLNADLTVANIHFQVKENANVATILPIVALFFMANESDLSNNVSNGSVTINGLETGIGNSFDQQAKTLVCYPNPATGILNICFKVAQDGDDVNISVYDIFGQKVAEIVSGKRAAGTNFVSWNINDSSASKLPNGIYFIKMTSGNKTEVQKIQFVR